MLKKFFLISRIVIINLIIFLLFIILIELFFGYWFKNNLKNKLSSERNIYRIYNTDFKFLKNTSIYIKNNYGFRVESLNENIHNPDYKAEKFGTVGCVALDKFGNLASGTSTRSNFSTRPRVRLLKLMPIARRRSCFLANSAL